jgi:hypothetical protein
MSKWIQFVDRGIPAGKKTRVWTVHPIDGANSNLGEIRWYAPWRQYAFYPTRNSLFERQCLRDIADFCEKETNAHRATNKRAAEKKNFAGTYGELAISDQP